MEFICQEEVLEATGVAEHAWVASVGRRVLRAALWGTQYLMGMLKKGGLRKGLRKSGQRITRRTKKDMSK